MNLNIADLKHLNGKELNDGYRLVYFNNGNYQISSYSKTIDGFINELNDYNPYNIYDNKNEFVSIEKLLQDISNKYNENEVYLYKIDGTLIASYNKNLQKN